MSHFFTLFHFSPLLFNSTLFVFHYSASPPERLPQITIPARILPLMDFLETTGILLPNVFTPLEIESTTNFIQSLITPKEGKAD